MGNFFLLIYRFFQARKPLFYAVFLATLAGLAVGAARIRLEENVMQMLPHEKRMDEFSRFLASSKFTDRVVLFVSDTDTTHAAQPQAQAAFADELAGRITQQLKPYIENFRTTANDSLIFDVFGTIHDNLPLFLEESDYAQLDSATAPAGVVRRVDSNYRTLIGPAGVALKQFIVGDPLGFGYVVLNKLKDFKPDENVELFNDHFFTRDRRHVFLFINPKYPSSNTARNIEFFGKLDQLIAAKAGGRYQVHYFGAPAVAAANATQIRADTHLTLLISLTLLVGVILLFFRRLAAPVLMLLPVLFGALFALAVIALTKGSISVIAVAAGSIVLGIAVNYSLHYLTHHRFHPNAAVVIEELAFPLTIGSLTTIAGFLCLQFVNVPVLQDLGTFAGLSLVGAAVATLVFLPHFLADDPAGVAALALAPPNRLKTLVTRFQQHPAWLLVLLVLTPVFLYFSFQVGFENDLGQVNFMTPQLRQSEALLNRISSLSKKTVFLVTSAPTLDEALARNERAQPIVAQLQREGQVLHFSGVSVLLPSRAEQQRRLARWRAYWTPARQQQVLARLTAAGAPHHFSATAFEPFRELVGKEYGLLSAPDETTLRNAFLNNLIEEKPGKATVLNLLTTAPGHARPLYARLGHLPGVYVFDRQYITDTLVNIVNKEFTFIAFWTSFLVFAALLLSYGRLELALIAFVPMVVAWIWILGLMALLGLKFNIINIILSTLVFALGDDYCIFTMDGMQHQYATGQREPGTTSLSILLSAVTTIIGLGTLFFAHHPALRSMAFVSVIGILSVWLVSQTLQPWLFRWFISEPAARRQGPYTLWGLAKSTFAFAYFVFGALLLNMTGLLLKLLPLPKARKQLFYHGLLRRFTGSLITVMANVRKVYLNDTGEQFATPAVVIANHQSFLDILLLVMQTPKLVLLTNDWVWNSPFFGAVVRMAGYHPAAQGAADILPDLRAQVAAGYSIVIFPEGTRSADGCIGRFHKGAFYLAEALGLDILPVLIHGSGETMRKNRFYLNDGQMTLKFLPRIKPDDTSFGEGYAARTKGIGRYFRAEYQRLAEQAENPDYFRNRLIGNYLYKGPVLEWYAKVKVKLENNYRLFDELLPRRGRILDVGCGYGFMANMLALTSQERTVRGLDYDDNKTTVAAHGYVNGPNVAFAAGNALTTEFGPQEAIILSDVLHYLQPEGQVALLQKCAVSLTENGVLVIRDGFKELAARHRGTELTEWFSTRFCKFNKTAEGGLSFLSQEVITDFAARNGFDVRMLDQTRYTSNLIFVCTKRG
ncbi:MAG: 1-acyl-sn-glycerol-3-phosphate acyltransferase [Bacteroidota bacterium]|nr:1-acyl-sn-glycerol-3-phosphate acyltransferase [Bacteroidota bacterium]